MILDRQNTAVVVDSTSDLPERLAEDPNITIVPLTVHFGDESYLDWVELKPEAFYKKLPSVETLPRTSQPAVGVFAHLYAQLRRSYQRVYSIHLSGEFSGTYASACMAQQGMDGVKVIDSRVATGGIALLIDRLMERLGAGVDEEEFERYAARYIQERGFYFIPETLDYLAKGGRIGRAAHLVGTLLRITPVLTIRDGVADSYKRVRGMRRALEAMQGALLSQTEPNRPIYLGFMHAFNFPLLDRMREAVQSIPDRQIEVRFTTTVGPVIGTYSGPGATGFCFIQEENSEDGGREK